MFKFLKILFEKYNNNNINPKIIIDQSSSDYNKNLNDAKVWLKKVRTCPECGYYSKDHNPEDGTILYAGSHDYKPCVCYKCGCHYRYEINHTYKNALNEEIYRKVRERFRGL